jgi:hypothetical protein
LDGRGLLRIDRLIRREGSKILSCEIKTVLIAGLKKRLAYQMSFKANIEPVENRSCDDSVCLGDQEAGILVEEAVLCDGPCSGSQ